MSDFKLTYRCNYCGNDIENGNHYCKPKIKEITRLYNELIYAVINKYADETRHQTALRYINEREHKINETPASNDKWSCRRCKQEVNMIEKTCGCTTSPSPWEPIL